MSMKRLGVANPEFVPFGGTAVYSSVTDMGIRPDLYVNLNL